MPDCCTHTSCRATEAAVRAWMVSAVRAGEFREALTDEPQYTELAEAAAHDFDHDDWLDDETHPVWDWAIEAFDTTSTKRSR